MLTYEDISYVVAIPAIILVALGLIGIGLSVTRPEGPHLIRKHAGAERYYRSMGSDLSDATGEMTIHERHEPAHYSEPSDDPLWIIEQQIEGYTQVGRRGLESPVRHQFVDEKWMPQSQSVRITILETHTAEYLFARKPKDQLNITRFVRSYVYAG